MTPGGGAHGALHDTGQRGSSGRTCAGGVVLLVGLHSPEEGAAAMIAVRKSRQMIVEVFHYLALGLDDESQAPPIARKSRCGADGQRTGVPERVEPARCRTEFLEARATPDEVVVLFASRLLHRLPGLAIARYQRTDPDRVP